jgi:hypothetical protein
MIIMGKDEYLVLLDKLNKIQDKLQSLDLIPAKQVKADLEAVANAFRDNKETNTWGIIPDPYLEND